MAGLSPKTAVRAGTLFPLLLLALVVVPGCGDDGYPSDLTYTARTDPIVLLPLPEEKPKEIDRPGRLDEWIATLPARGGKLLDVTGAPEKQQLTQIKDRLAKGQLTLNNDEARALGLSGGTDVPKDQRKQELEARRDQLDARIKVVEALPKTLETIFGKPAAPKVDPGKDESGEPNFEIDESARLDATTLADGSRLYRRHCLHCHGLDGDGRGPTAPWVNPHPRDYRLGQFKFTSSAYKAGARKARREDLLRTLKQGVEGTSMPSFGLLDEEKELEPLISYVMHLSLRGQVEKQILEAVLGPEASDEVNTKNLTETAQDKLKIIWKDWQQTQKKAVKVYPAPPSLADAGHLSPKDEEERTNSVRRGFVQFTTGTAQCRKCHNDFGRANDFLYDNWGTIVRPANLTTGIYRGGRRPLDLYYRISAGIAPVGMPSFVKDTPGDPSSAGLEPEDIWDIVNFLQAMPYPKMLPEDIREQVYGQKREQGEATR
jgi:mono/diheme cytochrome c family protein